MVRNEIKKIDSRVTKRFVSKQGLVKEVLGLNINGLLFGDSIDLLSYNTEKIETLLLIDALTADECIDQQLVSREFINKYIAQKLNETIRVFDKLNKGFLTKYWINYITNLATQAISIKHLYNADMTLKSLLEDNFENIVLIHGDLHLGNILYDIKEKKLTLIDFEHAKFAPIELELVNSLFWNDSKSLDVAYIIANCPYINMSGIIKLLPVYLTEQLVIANNLGDRKKIALLLKQAQHSMY